MVAYAVVVRMLREELQLLQEQGSYVGEVVKPMDKKKVLVKVITGRKSDSFGRCVSLKCRCLNLCY